VQLLPCKKEDGGGPFQLAILFGDHDFIMVLPAAPVSYLYVDERGRSVSNNAPSLEDCCAQLERFLNGQAPD
jgi:hypothetical protein